MLQSVAYHTLYCLEAPFFKLKIRLRLRNFAQGTSIYRVFNISIIFIIQCIYNDCLQGTSSILVTMNRKRKEYPEIEVLEYQVCEREHFKH